MFKLVKYIKPFIIGLLVTVALLFGQAMCDLNLPNYMSDIVNIGIQQNGITSPAPDAISIEGMRLLTLFMTDSGKSLINDHYSLVSASSTDLNGTRYDSIYKNAVDKELYVRNSKEVPEELKKEFGLATWTFIYSMQSIAANNEQSQEQSSTMFDLKEVDLSKVYESLPMISMLPEEIIASSRDKAFNMDDMIINQSGVAFAKALYVDLGRSISNIQSGYIVKIGLYMLLIALLGGLATVLVSLLSSRIAAGVAKNLRRDVFRKVSEFSNAEYDKFSTASLITRTTNDITQIQVVLALGIRMLCYAPIMAVGGVIMAIEKSASMAWIIALACVALLGIMLVVFTLAMPKFKLIQKLVDRLNLVSRENLSGMMVIRAFGTQENEKNRFDKANTDLTMTNLFVNRVMVAMFPIMMLIMNGITLLVVWVGGHQIADAHIQVGDMMAFMQYAMQVIMSFLMISMMFIFVPRAAVSAARIAEILESTPTVLDPAVPKEFDPDKKGLVEFNNVSFKYNGAEEYALQNISFVASPGETTAFIGPTGSGKSTIASLLLRFFDVTEGSIKVSGVDVRDISQNTLRDTIGYVPQKGILLSGTIESNLKYGDKNATDEEMQLAADIAQASEFINEKPEKYDSDISQGGSNVSGGQKQRLSIARALVKNPSIFIFDDSFSALDFKTDVTLRKALKQHTGDSTVLIVAQRISTIMGAEQIIVLDEGKIVGKGTHKELLASCPEYYEIASSQLSKEELA